MVGNLTRKLSSYKIMNSKHICFLSLFLSVPVALAQVASPVPEGAGDPQPKGLLDANGVFLHPAYSNTKGADERGFVWKEFSPGKWKKVASSSPAVNSTLAIKGDKAEVYRLLSQAEADAMRRAAQAQLGPLLDEKGQVVQLTPDVVPVELPEPPAYKDRFYYLVKDNNCLLLPKASVLDFPEGLSEMVSSYEKEVEADPKKEVVGSFPGPFAGIVRTVPVDIDASGIGYSLKSATVEGLKSNNLILVAVYNGNPVEMRVNLVD